MSDRVEDAFLGEVMQLLVAAQAVAAVGAELTRSLDGRAIPEAVAREVLHTATLAAPALGNASVEQKRAALGAIRALFRQAAELLDQPERPPGWAYEEPAILNAQGRASGAVGPVLAAVLDRRGPPADGRRRVLDVGTGAGWLAIALARAVPDSEIVGIDIWPPALACARENVAAEGLGDRVRIVEANVLELANDVRYDAVWLPGPFLPLRVIEPALSRVRAALRPGGLVCFGLYAGQGDPLSSAFARLLTARSGGHPCDPEEVVSLLEKAGLRDVREEPRTWKAPVRLVVGAA